MALFDRWKRAAEQHDPVAPLAALPVSATSQVQPPEQKSVIPSQVVQKPRNYLDDAGSIAAEIGQRDGAVDTAPAYLLVACRRGRLSQETDMRMIAAMDRALVNGYVATTPGLVHPDLANHDAVEQRFLQLVREHGTTMADDEARGGFDSKRKSEVAAGRRPEVSTMGYVHTCFHTAFHEGYQSGYNKALHDRGIPTSERLTQGNRNGRSGGGRY